jgi:ABC-2 type transport system permease protein
VLGVTRRVFRGFKHDRRAIGLLVFAPILAMTVFGIAFAGNITNVDVIVVNEDAGYVLFPNASVARLSEVFVDNLDTGVLNIERMSDLDAAVQKVRDGDSWAVIHFPANFTRAVMTGNSTTIEVRADKSNAQVYAAIVMEMREAAEKTMEGNGLKLPVSFDDSNAIYGKDAEFSDFLIPGVITFAIFLLTTLLTLLTFTTERVGRTLDRVLATPATELEIVLGYALAFGVIGTCQAIILVSYGVLVFHILIEGSLLLAFLITALLAMTSQALGILLSSAARTEAQAVQMLPVIILPVFLLSGIFWPLEAMPFWLRPLSYGLPPTWAAQGLRNIMIRGWGFAEVWPQVLALIVFLGLFLVLATLSLRRRR